MPVAHVGLSRGPRPFPNGFRTGRTAATTTTTPPVFLHRSEQSFDNRTTTAVDNRSRLVASSARTYDADNRSTFVYQS